MLICVLNLFLILSYNYDKNKGYIQCETDLKDKR